MDTIEQMHNCVLESRAVLSSEKTPEKENNWKILNFQINYILIEPQWREYRNKNTVISVYGFRNPTIYLEHIIVMITIIYLIIRHGMSLDHYFKSCLS